MKIGIFGDRNIEDVDAVVEKFNEFLSSIEGQGNHTVTNTSWLYGGGAGAAKVIAESLKDVGADVITFKPWHFVNKKLPFSTLLFWLRNKQIIENSDMAVVFTSGNAPDTEVDGVYKLGEKLGVPVVTVEI